MLDLTPLEAAEKLDKLLFFWKYTCKKDDGVLNYIKAMKLAISCLRAIAAGEYKRVVHAHYGPENRCSVCGAPCKTFEHCANKPSEPVCWNCGALMDDSEEQKK